MYIIKVAKFDDLKITLENVLSLLCVRLLAGTNPAASDTFGA
jgi:hypothetical protein